MSSEAKLPQNSISESSSIGGTGCSGFQKRFNEFVHSQYSGSRETCDVLKPSAISSDIAYKSITQFDGPTFEPGQTNEESEATCRSHSCPYKEENYSPPCLSSKAKLPQNSISESSSIGGTGCSGFQKRFNEFVHSQNSGSREACDVLKPSAISGDIAHKSMAQFDGPTSEPSQTNEESEVTCSSHSCPYKEQNYSPPCLSSKATLPQNSVSKSSSIGTRCSGFQKRFNEFVHSSFQKDTTDYVEASDSGADYEFQEADVELQEADAEFQGADEVQGTDFESQKADDLLEADTLQEADDEFQEADDEFQEADDELQEADDGLQRADESQEADDELQEDDESQEADELQDRNGTVDVNDIFTSHKKAYTYLKFRKESYLKLRAKRFCCKRLNQTQKNYYLKVKTSDSSRIHLKMKSEKVKRYNLKVKTRDLKKISLKVKNESLNWVNVKFANYTKQSVIQQNLDLQIGATVSVLRLPCLVHKDSVVDVTSIPQSCSTARDPKTKILLRDKETYRHLALASKASGKERKVPGKPYTFKLRYKTDLFLTLNAKVKSYLMRRAFLAVKTHDLCSAIHRVKKDMMTCNEQCNTSGRIHSHVKFCYKVLIG